MCTIRDMGRDNGDFIRRRSRLYVQVRLLVMIVVVMFVITEAVLAGVRVCGE